MTVSENLPLLTFALFAYNQENYIHEALQGALSQTYSPLEVILSDDCSTDRTFRIMKEMTEVYKGPHKIILNRNERNLGVAGHINRVMELVTGELIVAAAGDDISFPERTQSIYDAYITSGKKAKSIFSNMVVIDTDGKQKGLHRNSPIPKEIFAREKVLREGVSVFGCSHAWSKQVFEIFGPILKDIFHEDIIIPFRSTLIGDISYIHKPLIAYRRHNNNLWKTIQEIHSPKQYRSYTISRLLDNVSIWNNCLRDLTRYNEIMRDKVNELKWAEMVLVQKIKEAELNKKLLSLNLVNRLKIVFNTSFPNIKFRKKLKIYFTLFSPELYYYFLKIRVSINEFLNKNK